MYSRSENSNIWEAPTVGKNFVGDLQTFDFSSKWSQA